MMPRNPNHRSAFTLIELLVVIGVIAIVLGILLPVLAKARRSAYLVTCASNLHQIGVACLQYVADSHGLLPNNSYTLGEDPLTISPFPPSGTAAATWASTRGNGSTCNYQWFDAVAAINGWNGNRTIASRCGAGQDNSFRRATQYLWCPCIDQAIQDPGIFATNYGIRALCVLLARQSMKDVTVVV
jgi:prepilin-type N-terminal cleavage/methylation domain-containing protein